MKITANEIIQMTDNIWAFIIEFASWEAVKNLVNSESTIALLGSCAGAFAGAVAAQRIIERNKRRDELLQELRNTNAGIAIAFGICNSFLAIKRQYIRELKKQFDSQKTELISFLQKQETGEVSRDSVFNFLADLRTLQFQSFPNDILRTIVFERLSLTGRPLNLIEAIVQTTQCLNESIRYRNNLLEDYKVRFAKENKEFIYLYFGLPYGNNRVNRDYSDLINAIYNQTNDGIFFSQLLCGDLHKHGNQLMEEFRKKFKKDVPSVSEVDFRTVIAEGLMPDEKDYDDWTKAFATKE